MLGFSGAANAPAATAAPGRGTRRRCTRYTGNETQHSSSMPTTHFQDALTRRWAIPGYAAGSSPTLGSQE